MVNVELSYICAGEFVDSIENDGCKRHCNLRCVNYSSKGSESQRRIIALKWHLSTR